MYTASKTRNENISIAADIVCAQRIQATVVDGRFVKPLDVGLIVALARRIPRIVSIEENVRQGGFGSAVLEALNDVGLASVGVERIGLPDAFVEHGPEAMLRAKHGLNASAIAAAALHLLQQKDGLPAVDRSFQGKTASLGR